MAEILVVYKSHYGSTKQYAEWIAAELGTTAREQGEVAASELMGYDCVVYGGGLYASGILGAKLVAKNPCRNLVVFTVGAADPLTTDYTKIMERNFNEKPYQPAKVFHFRGKLEYEKMSVVHRAMMAAKKWMTVDRKKPEDLSYEDRMFAETYNGSFGSLDKEAIRPLVDFVHSLVDEGRNS